MNYECCSNTYELMWKSQLETIKASVDFRYFGECHLKFQICFIAKDRVDLKSYPSPTTYSLKGIDRHLSYFHNMNTAR